MDLQRERYIIILENGFVASIIATRLDNSSGRICLIDGEKLIASFCENAVRGWYIATPEGD